MNFSRYAYRSHQTQILSEADLYALVEQARRLNALDGITGLLFRSGDYFFQIVEGGHDAIADLKLCLARDPRHQSIETLLDEEADGRLFLGWDMRLVDDGSDVRAQAVASLISPRQLPENVALFLHMRAA